MVAADVPRALAEPRALPIPSRHALQFTIISRFPPSFFPLPALQEADLARLPSAVAGLQEAVNRANEQLRQLRALQPAALRCGGTCGRRLEHPLPEHSFRLRQRQSAVGQTIKWGRMHRLALCY